MKCKDIDKRRVNAKRMNFCSRQDSITENVYPLCAFHGYCPLHHVCVCNAIILFFFSRMVVLIHPAWMPTDMATASSSSSISSASSASNQGEESEHYEPLIRSLNWRLMWAQYPLDVWLFERILPKTFPLLLKPDSCQFCKGFGFTCTHTQCQTCYTSYSMHYSFTAIIRGGQQTIVYVTSLKCKRCGFSSSAPEFAFLSRTCVSCIASRLARGHSILQESLLAIGDDFLVPDVIPIIADYASMHKQEAIDKYCLYGGSKAEFLEDFEFCKAQFLEDFEFVSRSTGRKRTASEMEGTEQ